MKIYQVGGVVRDTLLGLAPTDRDFVVIGATYQQMLDLGFTAVGKDFPVFLHPQTGEEYALARTERKNSTGYTGFTFHCSPFITLEEDLQRRDLTINAIALDETGKIIDPFNGISDLQNRVLRHVSDAFIEDPLRVLRVCRFAARFADLGFSIHPITLKLMQQISTSGELQALTAERIWQEFAKALMTNNPQVFIQTLADSYALKAIMPELVDVHDDFVSHENDINNTKNHLKTAANLNTDLAIRYSVLVWDLANRQITSICKRYKIPKNCTNLAILSNKLKPSLLKIINELDHSLTKQKQQQLATQILNIIKQTDFYRRQQQLIDVLTVMQITMPNYQYLYDLLEKCAQQSALITFSELPNNLKGFAIAAKLDELRINSIKALIKKI